ncbi:DUF808 domain-containing protein [Corynebacterium bovis]|uniref:DUF808 domain-containing protein n=1 Tax=Corynebacterium bovis TaxID=36808 RepID=UPI0031387009
MAGGLAALLDDVALIARKAAAATDDIASAAGRTSTKAAAVVVDDTAVTPRFVQGLAPARELPLIWRIAKGSLVNKLLIILPVALLLSWLAPWALTPILMLGGFYLAFEGAEKIWEFLTGHGHGDGHGTGEVPDAGGGRGEGDDAALPRPDAPATAGAGGASPADPARAEEDRLVRAAVRTDLILSAEIMVISLNEVAAEPVLEKAVVLIVVGLLITALVYGAVAGLVKMDDLGLHIARGHEGAARRVGRALVAAMPKVMSVLSVVGTVAMLWVGGHILLVGSNELGWHAPFAVVHHLEEAVEGAGGAVVWLVKTGCSAVVGFAVGSVVTAVVMLVRRVRRR